MKLHHLKNYKGFFSLLHTVVNLFYCIEQSGLTFRLSYDWARKNIRVSWNASLTPRAIMGGIKNQLHVDGISVYEIDRESGLLTEHRVEQLLVNNAPVMEPQGIFVTVRNLATEGPESIPVLSTSNHGNTVFEFRRPSMIGFGDNNHRQSSSLFSQSDDSSSESHPMFDQKAFDAKNQSRKKFGLKPLSPSEFVNFDCQRPEVCCDLGLKKMCCSSGQNIVDGIRGRQTQMAPVPVVAGRYPRGGPNGMTNPQLTLNQQLITVGKPFFFFLQQNELIRNQFLKERKKMNVHYYKITEMYVGFTIRLILQYIFTYSRDIHFSSRRLASKKLKFKKTRKVTYYHFHLVQSKNIEWYDYNF